MLQDHSGFSEIVDGQCFCGIHWVSSKVHKEGENWDCYKEAILKNEQIGDSLCVCFFCAQAISFLKKQYLHILKGCNFPGTNRSLAKSQVHKA